MQILPIELFGFAVDIPFLTPQGFQQAKLEEFGAQLCDPAKGLGLRIDQVRLRKSDDLYGYELIAQFFGDNGTLVRTADRVKLAVRNARNAADWNLVRETFVRLYNIMNFAPTSVTTLSTHVHAKFEETIDRDQFMQGFEHGFELLRSAALGYVRIADWEKEIRVLIEQSNAIPDGIFVAWDTQFTNVQDWDTFLFSVPTMMENAANLFGVGFEPFKQA
jgi:hypothetical protein